MSRIYVGSKIAAIDSVKKEFPDRILVLSDNPNILTASKILKVPIPSTLATYSGESKLTLHETWLPNYKFHLVVPPE